MTDISVDIDTGPKTETNWFMQLHSSETIDTPLVNIIKHNKSPGHFYR